MVSVIIGLFILLPAVILHEYAHGWVAYRCGDMTAKLAGRLTFNPLKHIDPVGTVILPGILLIMRSLGYPVFIFGWAKPVPVNFMALNNPRRDMMLVGLAGPAMNILIALCFSLLLRLDLADEIKALFLLAVFINLLLASFNLLPIPPLDGSRFVMGFLHGTWLRLYRSLEPYGMLIVVLLLYVGVLDEVVYPMIGLFGRLMGVNF